MDEDLPRWIRPVFIFVVGLVLTFYAILFAMIILHHYLSILVAPDYRSGVAALKILCATGVVAIIATTTWVVNRCIQDEEIGFLEKEYWQNAIHKLELINII